MPCLQLFSAGTSQIPSIISGIKKKEKKDSKSSDKDSSDLADSFDSEVKKKYDDFQ